MEINKFLITFVLTVFLLPHGTRATPNATFVAQQISQISPCGLTCLFLTIPAVGCSLLDTACQCSDSKLVELTANCMYANCTITQTLQLSKIQAEICERPYESHNQKLKIMTLICTILTYTVVLLRLLTRYLLSQSLGLDDFFIIAASCSDAVFICFGALFESHGFGEHIWNIDYAIIPNLFLWFYICEIFYVLNIGLVKLSLLFFYLRLFPRRSFQITCWITMAFCALSAIAFVLTTIFQCTPVSYVFDKDLPGKCVNYNIVAWVHAAINIVQDIIIIVLPIPEVWPLQLTTKKKLGVSAMFGVGGFVCFISMIRLNSLKTFGLTSDPTWDNVDTTFWSTMETTSAIFCACMPSIRALLMHYFPKMLNSTKNVMTTLVSHSDNRKGSPPRSSGTSEEGIWVGHNQQYSSFTSVMAGDKTQDPSHNEPVTPPEKIHVKSDVELQNFQLPDVVNKNDRRSLIPARLYKYLDKSLPLTPQDSRSEVKGAKTHHDI